VVERQFPKLKVAGPIPVFRSKCLSRKARGIFFCRLTRYLRYHYFEHAKPFV